MTADAQSEDGRRTTGSLRSRRRSYDLALLAAYAVTATTVLLVTDLPAVVRTLLGVPLVVFAPGYAAVATALPSRPAGRDRGGLNRLERVVVAVGASLTLVVLVSLAVAPLYDGGLATVPYRPLLGGITLGGSVLAYARRRRRPAGDRAGVVDPRRSLGPARTPSVVDVALVVAVLVAVGTLGYGFAVPRESTDYTSVTLLTENESGAYVAGGYPDEAVLDEPTTVTVAIENNEGAERTYTVVAVVERFGPDGERTLQRRVAARETVSVATGETVRRPVTVTPGTLGDRLRVSYYVYRGDVSGTPGPEDAYRHVYLWLSVRPESGSG